MEQAWQQAEAANPALQAVQANLSTARGQQRDARAPLWNNPTVSGEWLRRRIPEPGQAVTNTRDWSAGLAQTFETAGQQGLRRRIAEDNMAATQADILDVRRQLRLEVAQRFFRVLGLQQRIAMERETLRLIEDSAAAVQKRFNAGEDTRLDNNLAQVEAEQARNQILLLQEQLIQARSDLAALLQLPPPSLPEVSGTLDTPLPRYTLEELLASVDRRPDLRAAALRVNGARSLLRLERAAVSPDVTVGVSYGREGSALGNDTLLGVNVALPIPLFRRNATGIGRAQTELTQREIDQRALSRDARAQLQALWRQWESLVARVERLQREVLPRLEENQRLSRIAYREGEIGLLQLLLLNRQVLDSRRNLLEAQTELRLTQLAIEGTSGWPGASGPLAEAPSPVNPNMVNP
ncbi:TolC family protein [Thermithiobacillus tepidarius DSM 3134]|uniref:TolC family protein n=1 Tax=Thermithiobacillus tepidarius TaxID=929 RepID=UPI003AB0B242